MSFDSGDSLERMTPAEVIGLARRLIGELTRLQAKYEELDGAFSKLKVEHQAVKDELARLKNLPPRPPHKPSGMDKATDRPDPQANGSKGGRSTQRRGGNLDKLTITHTVEVKVEAPVGSRHKGYEDIVVQDVVLNPSVTRYRRERWETPDGKSLVAPLDPGIVGGYGPHLHRLIVMLHFQGHVTCEKILALLKGMGVVISKRQVVRLLTAKLETFRAEDAEVLKAGLSSAPYVTVDDTGARHRGKAGVTTQIGSHNFTVFRTGESKSRQAFLERLCGRVAYDVVNEAALVSMRAHDLAQPLSDKLAGQPSRVFHCQADGMSHLSALGLADLRVAPNPVRVAREGALWGAVREPGLLGQTIVVSDGAGQFRVGEHAACWIHAERLVYKLIPANAIQRNAIVIARRMIWWFYRALKDTRQAPSPENAERLRARFDRVFNRMSTGYATLDKLLKRLFRLKDDLLRVLDHPEIPLNTNASERDIRVFVTKRKVSGGTVSDRGRDARDVMIGLAKTCAKLKIPFFDYLGARLGIPGRPVPHLATLLRHAPS
jgi:Transposase IS66 family